MPVASSTRAVAALMLVSSSAVRSPAATSAPCAGGRGWAGSQRPAGLAPAGLHRAAEQQTTYAAQFRQPAQTRQAQLPSAPIGWPFPPAPDAAAQRRQSANVRQVPLLHITGTVLSGAAGQAAVQVLLGLACRRLAFEHLLHQVDASAWTRRARRRAAGRWGQVAVQKPPMHALRWLGWPPGPSAVPANSGDKRFASGGLSSSAYIGRG